MANYAEIVYSFGLLLQPKGKPKLMTAACVLRSTSGIEFLVSSVKFSKD
jgi:hypothetical protein